MKEIILETFSAVYWSTIITALYIYIDNGKASWSNYLPFFLGILTWGGISAAIKYL